MNCSCKVHSELNVLRNKWDMLFLTFARRLHAVAGVFGREQTRALSKLFAYFNIAFNFSSPTGSPAHIGPKNFSVSRCFAFKR